jgi:hypothetical protein
MVHGIASVRYIFAILVAAVALFATVMALADEQRIVIVASSDSSFTAISAKDVRRAFLGASVVLNGIEVKPLLNQSNQLAAEVFLQKVLYMSADAYERQLLARTFQGGIRPKAYDNFNDLIGALHDNRATITFMLHETAVKTRGIRIIGEL